MPIAREVRRPVFRTGRGVLSDESKLVRCLRMSPWKTGLSRWQHDRQLCRWLSRRSLRHLQFGLFYGPIVGANPCVSAVWRTPKLVSKHHVSRHHRRCDRRTIGGCGQDGREQSCDIVLCHREGQDKVDVGRLPNYFTVFVHFPKHRGPAHCFRTRSIIHSTSFVIQRRGFPVFASQMQHADKHILQQTFDHYYATATRPNCDGLDIFHVSRGRTSPPPGGCQKGCEMLVVLD